MPGMNTGLNTSDPAVVAAFRAALLHQGLIALLIFFVLGVAWLSLRAWLPLAAAGTAAGTATASALPEPSWRTLLRYGFGLLWLFDGILQAQPTLAIGLPSQVIEPTAASSPRWVQVAVNWAGLAWSHHPAQAGASAVWIQLGIGMWLLAAARGLLSRLAGLVSVGWGLIVWAFGESFGGIVAPGLTWLFGAPGAAAIYCAAGLLIALPERAWRSRLPGQITMGGLGVFLIGMAVLQAWPGRGFWQGTAGGKPGPLAGMTTSMARTPQPHAFSAWIDAFTACDEAHGFAVNLAVVLALALAGAAFLTCRPRLIRPALAGFIVLCLADWVLIEDFGFFGGLGTDPNSMVPFALLAAAGYLALARLPATAAVPATAAGTVAGDLTGARTGSRWRRLRTAISPRALASASIGSVAGLGAIGLIILGAAPMAAAQVSPVAGAILGRAIGGAAAPLNFRAPQSPWPARTAARPR